MTGNASVESNTGGKVSEKTKVGVRRVFIDSTITGILTNQKLGGKNTRENNPIGQLRLSLNEANPRTSMTFVSPNQPGSGEQPTSLAVPIESGETERNLVIKREL